MLGFNEMPSSLLRLLREPVELDLSPIALLHGAGDSVPMGDGRGVISVIAASIGLENAEPGDNEPAMLNVLGFLRRGARGVGSGMLREAVLISRLFALL